MAQKVTFKQRENALIGLPDEVYTFFFSQELENALESLVVKYGLGSEQESELQALVSDLLLSFEDYKNLGNAVRSRIGLAGEPAEYLASDLKRIIVKKFPDYFGFKEEAGIVEPEKVRIETFEPTPIVVGQKPVAQPTPTPPPETKFGNVRVETPQEHEFRISQAPQTFSSRVFLRKLTPQEIPEEKKKAKAEGGTLNWQVPPEPEEPRVPGGVKIETLPEPPKPPTSGPIDLSKI